MTNQRNIPALHQKVNLLVCIKSSYKSIGKKKININRRKAKDRNVNKCQNKCSSPLVIKEVQSKTADAITHLPNRLQFKNYKRQEGSTLACSQGCGRAKEPSLSGAMWPHRSSLHACLCSGDCYVQE